MTIDVEHHLREFAMAFVESSRKDRWIGLLGSRNDNTFRNSAKLMQHLDHRYCTQIDGEWELQGDLCGVYYDFYDDPVVITLDEAVIAGHFRDAIFSIEPGRLAIHFSHEGWSWLCRKA